MFYFIRFAGDSDAYAMKLHMIFLFMMIYYACLNSTLGLLCIIVCNYNISKLHCLLDLDKSLESKHLCTGWSVGLGDAKSFKSVTAIYPEEASDSNSIISIDTLFIHFYYIIKNYTLPHF